MPQHDNVPTRRLFFALPIPRVWEKAYQPALQAWRAHLKMGRRFKAVPPENRHLTLLFLGNVREADLSALEKETGEFAGKHQGFPLQLSELVAAPPHRRRKTMLWHAGPLNEQYTALHKALRELAGPYIPQAPPPADREPVPHCTLARFPARAEARLPAPEPLSETLQVNRLELWESELRPGGSNYTRLSSFELLAPTS